MAVGVTRPKLWGRDGEPVYRYDRELEAEADPLPVVDPPSAASCPCECNRGGFCGGCGHAGCGGR